MKKIILIGNIGSGKTTISQWLNGMEQKYKKTQMIEIYDSTIDTPGEFLECRRLLQALVVTSVEADIAVFVQDASQDRFLFSPGLSTAFPIPVVGVVTKTDAATEEQIKQAQELLGLAGAHPVFCVSAISGEGMNVLRSFLEA